MERGSIDGANPAPNHDDIVNAIKERPASCWQELRQKEKNLKAFLEKVLYQYSFGSYLFQFVGGTAAVTTLVQTAMGYY